MRLPALFYSLLLISSVSLGQRIVRSINTDWTFTMDKDTSQVNLPHTWNAKDAFSDSGKYKRGTGFYSKTIAIPENWKGKQLFIKFEGSNQITQLSVNNKIVGKHIGGYTGFSFDITKQVKFGEENTLLISCNNAYNTAIPPLSADFTFYGGVYRDVELIVTPPVYFETSNAANGNMQIKTPEVSEKQATVNISHQLISKVAGSKKYIVNLTLESPNHKVVTTAKKAVRLSQNNNTAINFALKISKPLLWSPENPNLYTAKLSVTDAKTGAVIDEVSSHFGCRWFYADAEKGFFLNGKKYRLMGVNRHQDFKNLGNALSNKLHENDLKTIKAMGSNFIRIAHYPQDPVIYDWCDKLGIIAWSEIPIVNQITNSEAFFTNCLQMQKEHVLQFMNHPSVVMWGYMNEVFLRPPFNSSTTKKEKETYIQATVKLAQQLNNLTKELDSSRLTVMALHGSQIYNTSGIADIPDVVGWNLYMGWYGGKLEQFGSFLDNEHKNHPNRPILISEYGPGADVRLQTFEPNPWDFSGAYQLKNHSSYVNQVMERDFVLGMAAWNYADFASTGRVDAIPNLNQKGLLTYDRQTKDVYHYYQAQLLTEPYVYVAGKNHEKVFLTETNNKQAILPLTIFSNSDSVTIFMDNKTIATIPVTKRIATYNIPVNEGVHKIRAEINGAVHNRQFTIRFKRNLTQTIALEPLAVNIGSLCDFKDDVSGEIWIAEKAYTPGSWGYVGGKIYQKSKSRFQGTDRNILGTQNDPLYQTMRENINSYKFDVKEGKYRVTLLFAEPDSKNAEKLVYDLGNEEQKEQTTGRIFNVWINDQLLLPNLNIANDYGANKAIEISYELITKQDITIKLESVKGQSILSGIKLETVY